MANSLTRGFVKALATIWEQLAHMVSWQDFLLRIAEGKEPKAPRSAELGWPAMPPVARSLEGWAKLVRRFERGLAAAASTVAKERTPIVGVKPGSRRTFGGAIW